jgi:hypothetical protein
MLTEARSPLLTLKVFKIIASDLVATNKVRLTFPERGDSDVEAL